MFRLIVYNRVQRRADVLLRDGALQAVVFAVLHVCGLGISQAGGANHLSTALSAFWQCLDVVVNMTDEVRTQLTEDVYTLSRNDIYRVNVAVYRLLDSCIDDYYVRGSMRPQRCMVITCGTSVALRYRYCTITFYISHRV
jgi:hypothetical protein